MDEIGNDLLFVHLQDVTDRFGFFHFHFSADISKKTFLVTVIRKRAKQLKIKGLNLSCYKKTNSINY